MRALEDIDIPVGQLERVSKPRGVDYITAEALAERVRNVAERFLAVEAIGVAEKAVLTRQKIRLEVNRPDSDRPDRQVPVKPLLEQLKTCLRKALGRAERAV